MPSGRRAGLIVVLTGAIEVAAIPVVMPLRTSPPPDAVQLPATVPAADTTQSAVTHASGSSPAGAAASPSTLPASPHSIGAVSLISRTSGGDVLVQHIPTAIPGTPNATALGALSGIGAATALSAAAAADPLGAASPPAAPAALGAVLAAPFALDSPGDGRGKLEQLPGFGATPSSTPSPMDHVPAALPSPVLRSPHRLPEDSSADNLGDTDDGIATDTGGDASPDDTALCRNPSMISPLAAGPYGTIAGAEALLDALRGPEGSQSGTSSSSSSSSTESGSSAPSSPRLPGMSCARPRGRPDEPLAAAAASTSSTAPDGTRGRGVSADATVAATSAPPAPHTVGRSLGSSGPAAVGGGLAPGGVGGALGGPVSRRAAVTLGGRVDMPPMIEAPPTHTRVAIFYELQCHDGERRWTTWVTYDALADLGRRLNGAAAAAAEILNMADSDRLPALPTGGGHPHVELGGAAAGVVHAALADSAGSSVGASLGSNGGAMGGGPLITSSTFLSLPPLDPSDIDVIAYVQPPDPSSAMPLSNRRPLVAVVPEPPLPPSGAAGGGLVVGYGVGRLMRVPPDALAVVSRKREVLQGCLVHRRGEIAAWLKAALRPFEADVAACMAAFAAAFTMASPTVYNPAVATGASFASATFAASGGFALSAAPPPALGLGAPPTATGMATLDGHRPPPAIASPSGSVSRTPGADGAADGADAGRSADSERVRLSVPSVVTMGPSPDEIAALMALTAQLQLRTVIDFVRHSTPLADPSTRRGARVLMRIDADGTADARTGPNAPGRSTDQRSATPARGNSPTPSGSTQRSSSVGSTVGSPSSAGPTGGGGDATLWEQLPTMIAIPDVAVNYFVGERKIVVYILVCLHPSARWRLHRRYAEFSAMAKKAAAIIAVDPNAVEPNGRRMACPSLPPKTVFGSTSRSRKLVEKRRGLLQTFTQDLLGLARRIGSVPLADLLYEFVRPRRQRYRPADELLVRPAGTMTKGTETRAQSLHLTAPRDSEWEPAPFQYCKCNGEWFCCEPNSVNAYVTKCGITLSVTPSEPVEEGVSAPHVRSPIEARD